MQQNNRVLLGFTGFYYVSLGFTGFLLAFTGFYWVSLGFYWLLLGFIRFYWVLLGFGLPYIRLDLTRIDIRMKIMVLGYFPSI